MKEFDLCSVKPDLRKLLLIGKEGTGKTEFIKTMPKPIYLFSFDSGYLTLAGEEKIKTGVFMDKDRYHPKAYSEFEKKFTSLIGGELYKGPDGKEEPYKTVALDNMSFMSTQLFDWIQYTNSNIDKPGGYTVYGLVRSKLQDTINKAVLSGYYIVCTALVEGVQDATTQEVFFAPTMVGSIKNEIGAWFDAVFYMEVDKKSDGSKLYKLITVGDKRYRARIRVPSSAGKNIKAVEVPDFRVLTEKFKGTCKEKK